MTQHETASPTCNIDAKGKRVRLIGGFVVLDIALVLAIAVWMTWLPTWVLIPALAALLSGLFMMYEGWAGWCAVRAMGIKTPI